MHQVASGIIPKINRPKTSTICHYVKISDEKTKIRLGGSVKTGFDLLSFNTILSQFPVCAILSFSSNYGRCVICIFSISVNECFVFLHRLSVF